MAGRRSHGLKQWTEAIRRNLRWMARELGDLHAAVMHLDGRVSALEAQLGVTPPPPPKSSRERQREAARSLRLMVATGRIDPHAVRAAARAERNDLAEKGTPAAGSSRVGRDEQPEGNPMSETHDTAGGA